MIFSVQTKKNTTKYRYGVKVSHNVKENINFHKNVNTLRKKTIVIKHWNKKMPGQGKSEPFR